VGSVKFLTLSVNELTTIGSPMNQGKSQVLELKSLGVHSFTVKSLTISLSTVMEISKAWDP
jgi:hypothetical protein